MRIILSDELTNSNKEDIVNALYELTPKLPVFINYLKPVTDMIISERPEKERFIENKNDDRIYVKVIGDDIYTVDKEKEKKLVTLLKQGLSDKFLFNYYEKRNITSNARDGILNVQIIDNIQFNDISLFTSYTNRERVIYLYTNTNSVSEDKIECIKLESLGYDDLKIQFEDILSSKSQKIMSIMEIAIEQEKSIKDSVMQSVTMSDDVEKAETEVEGITDEELDLGEGILEQIRRAA